MKHLCGMGNQPLSHAVKSFGSTIKNPMRLDNTAVRRFASDVFGSLLESGPMVISSLTLRLLGLALTGNDVIDLDITISLLNGNLLFNIAREHRGSVSNNFASNVA